METPNSFIERGKVLYMSHMGTDLDIVNDARQSFATMSTPLSFFQNQIPHSHTAYSANVFALVPELRSADARLIGFLARGCRSQQWDAAVDELMDTELSADRAEQLLRWTKHMPTHWTPFAHQVVKFRMAAPVPIRTQC